jgi:nitrite reductase/ring-hydroxylating ferredoxin subunit
MTWSPAVRAERLFREGKLVARVGGKQIALFMVDGNPYACNNRCPHEGFPLREGTLGSGAESCVLTCNWHNWKFDLRSGANLYGGDKLRTYPVRIADHTVWVDVTDPPQAERQAAALANLRAACEDHEYDRIARELARLAKAGGDPAAAVAAAIAWSHARLEFGSTHAYAATAGWLRLHDETADPETRLICLAEAIGHIAWDVLREPQHPYPDGSAPWDEAAFLAAVEAQDEAAAIARVRGALASGLSFAALEHAFSAAALAHYADFGHSLIYVLHTGRLIARLGPGVAEPLLLALVRSLVYASREDLIPEFRAYAGARAALLEKGGPARAPEEEAPPPAALRGRSIEDTLAAVVGSRAPPEALHRALLGAAALDLLQFDTSWEARTDGTIAQNVGWLDFTHGLTFANAVRAQCAKFPELWSAGLLQLACFTGRNAAFTTPEPQLDAWRVADRDAFFQHCLARVTDHGEDQYIRSAHLLKTTLAVREEVNALPAESAAVALAALNRYVNTPPKRRHARRTAHQALAFVARED